MNPPPCKDFIVCKALDVISGNGAYRKYLHQCCENGEEWELKVAANIGAVGAVIKDLHALVDRVRRLPNSKLGKQFAVVNPDCYLLDCFDAGTISSISCRSRTLPIRLSSPAPSDGLPQGIPWLQALLSQVPQDRDVGLWVSRF